MFDSDVLAFAPSEEWEPIPDEVLEELGRSIYDDVQDRAENSSISNLSSVLLSVSGWAEIGARQVSQALTETTQVIARAEAQRLRLIATLVPHCQTAMPDGTMLDLTAHEVSVALAVSLSTADRMIHLARHLTTTLTATLDTLDAGRIGLRHAQQLHDATLGLDDTVARVVEARVLDRGAGKDPAAFGRITRRAVATLDPDWTDHTETARQDRAVCHQVFEDGTAEIAITAPVEVTTLIHQALSAYAATTKTELGGTVDCRMVHALQTWATSYLTTPGTPTRHGRPYTVNVTIDLPTFLGMTEHPADIPTVGPLPAAAARKLVVDGAPMRRLITDPMTGHLLDYGVAPT